MFHKEPIDAQVLINTAMRCHVSSPERVINGSLEYHCASKLDCLYISELFKRIDVNSKHGQNSKILHVDLSVLDSDRTNIIKMFQDICVCLEISIPIVHILSHEQCSGGWFVEWLKLSKTEIIKNKLFCRVTRASFQLVA